MEGFEEDLQSSLVFIMEEERRKRKREDEADPGEVKFEGSASSSQVSEEFELEEFEVEELSEVIALDSADDKEGTSKITQSPILSGFKISSKSKKIKILNDAMENFDMFLKLVEPDDVDSW